MFRLLAMCLIVCLGAAQAQAGMPSAKPGKRACDGTDPIGLWKMVHMWEEPDAQQVQQFVTNPHQYLYLNRNQTFVELIGTRKYQNPVRLEQELRSAAADKKLRQYVLNNGALYFYVDGKPTRAMYCEIVTRPAGRFKQGAMVLRTSTTTPPTQTIKLYARPALKEKP